MIEVRQHFNMIPSENALVGRLCSHLHLSLWRETPAFIKLIFTS